jgi:uncharacterized protein
MKFGTLAGRLSAILIAVGIAGGVFAPEARAAGFDCSKASTAVEKAICGDPKLSSLDEELSAAYSKALSLAVDRDAMKAEQRRWLTQVRNKCVDALCLEEAYRVRFAEIGERAPVTVEPVQPPVQEPVATPPAETPPASAPVAEPIVEARQDAAPATVPPEPLPSAPVPVPTPAYQTPMQQTPAPTVADAQFPGNANTVSAHAEGLTSLQMKVIGAILLLNAMVAIFLHRKGSLTIYSDYTDATFILLRADSHYTTPEVLDWCQAEGVDYILGVAPTSTLSAHVLAPEASTQARFDAAPDGAASWSRLERTVARVEAGADGTDSRFIVTSLEGWRRPCTRGSTASGGRPRTTSSSSQYPFEIAYPQVLALLVSEPHLQNQALFPRT